MFWTRRQSAVCRELKKLLAVKDAWIEWHLDDDRWIETVTIVFEYDTDPARSSFRAAFLDQVRDVVRSTDPGIHRRIRVIPREAVAS